MNAGKELAVCRIVGRRERAVPTRMAVDSDHTETALRGLGEQRDEALGAPRHPIGRPHRAVVVRDGMDRMHRHHFTGGREAAPPTQQDRHRLAAVPGEEMSSQRGVLILGETKHRPTGVRSCHRLPRRTAQPFLRCPQMTVTSSKPMRHGLAGV